MCAVDLDGGDELNQGNGLVVQPLLVGLCIIEEDDEVVVLSLVVDLALGGAASSHDELIWCRVTRCGGSSGVSGVW